MIIWFCHISKMNESNSIETIDKNLSEQAKFQLDEISWKLIKENHVVKN